MKLVLCIFEQLSSLKIDFHKSELFYFGKTKKMESDYKILFGYDIGSVPFRYLDISINFRRLRNENWKPVEDRFEKKLSSWIGKCFFTGIVSYLLTLSSQAFRCLCFLFLKFPRGLGRDWITSDHIFSGKAMVINGNIDC
jgi:hypothetical protein